MNYDRQRISTIVGDLKRYRDIFHFLDNAKIIPSKIVMDFSGIQKSKYYKGVYYHNRKRNYNFINKKEE